jgi:hypothetical protein
MKHLYGKEYYLMIDTNESFPPFFYRLDGKKTNIIKYWLSIKVFLDYIIKINEIEGN